MNELRVLNNFGSNFFENFGFDVLGVAEITVFPRVMNSSFDASCLPGSLPPILQTKCPRRNQLLLSFSMFSRNFRETRFKLTVFNFVLFSLTDTN